MSDPSFGKATTDFNNGIVVYFPKYIMNAAAESNVGAVKFVTDQFILVDLFIPDSFGE